MFTSGFGFCCYLEHDSRYSSDNPWVILGWCCIACQLAEERAIWCHNCAVCAGLNEALMVESVKVVSQGQEAIILFHGPRLRRHAASSFPVWRQMFLTFAQI